MNIAQDSSANVVIGPIVDVSGDLQTGLTIANNAIWLVKEASVSAPRNATTSAVSVAPGHYRIVLNATDTDTIGTLILGVSASAALPYSEKIEVWQAPTHALFYGSANQIATSAGVSAAVSGVLASYDVATSADVSAVVTLVLDNVGLSGAMVTNALTSWDVPTSADVSAIVSVVVAQALVDYDVASSADVSVVLSGVLASYGVASAGALITSAQVSAIGAQVLTDYDVPTSADVSAIHVAILANHKVNIGQVNDVSVSGAGTTADPWRPA